MRKLRGGLYFGALCAAIVLAPLGGCGKKEQNVATPAEM